MFTQFQVRYPTTSLISELVTIDRGKYVVRALVQIEGVTRATGLAAADTIELAEDTARSRALEVLGIHNWKPPISSVEYAQPPKEEALKQPQVYPVTESAFSEESFEPASITSISTDTSWLEDKFQPAPPELSVPFPPAKSVEVSSPSTDWKRNTFAENTPASVTPEEENEALKTTSKKVTPIRSRRHDVDKSPVQPPGSEIETSDLFEKVTPSTEPVDLSDELARIKSELKRLGWSDDQKNEFLERTFNKPSLLQLNQEDVLVFLEYLESFAKIDVQLKRIGWSKEKGRAYLIQTYNKRSRYELTPTELTQFLQHLELQADPIS